MFTFVRLQTASMARSYRSEAKSGSPLTKAHSLLTWSGVFNDALLRLQGHSHEPRTMAFNLSKAAFPCRHAHVLYYRADPVRVKCAKSFLALLFPLLSARMPNRPGDSTEPGTSSSPYPLTLASLLHHNCINMISPP